MSYKDIPLADAARRVLDYTQQAVFLESQDNYDPAEIEVLQNVQSFLILTILGAGIASLHISEFEAKGPVQ